MNKVAVLLIRHWKHLVVLNLAVLTVAAISALSVKKSWTAGAKLILPSTPANLNLKLGTLGDLSGNQGLVFSQQVDSRKNIVSIAVSEDTIWQVWSIDPQKALYPRLNEYGKLFTAKSDDTSTVISISVQGSNPNVARTRLANLIKVFQQRLDHLRRDDGTQRSKFIQHELVEAERNLNRDQVILADFQKNTSLVDSESQTKELVSAINSTVVTQGQLVGQFQASKARLETLSERLGQTPGQAIASLRLTEDPNYQEVRQKLAKLEVTLVAARSTYTDEAPNVQTLLLEREELLRQQASYITKAVANISPAQSSLGVEPSLGENYAALVKELILAESQTNALQQQYIQIQEQVNQLNAKLRKVPAARARLLKLQRQYNIAEGVYNGLTAQIEATKVNAFSTYPSVQILDQPAANPVPSGPGRKPVVLGAILAVLFGSVAIILLLESRDPLLTKDDLQKQQIPLVGKIPRFRRLGTGIDPQLEGELEFQRLASAISLMTLNHGRLMIVSASSNEGKTTVTLGLAIALLTLGFRVLLVDADFERAELTKRVGYFQPEKSQLKPQPIQLRPGLDLLIPNLKTDKAAEYIARGGLEQLLNFIQTNSDYDYVLIDTTPIGSANEPILMTRLIPDVLFVVQPGISKRLPFTDSIHHIRRNKAKILGLVTNCTEAAGEDYPYEQHRAEVEL